MIKSWTVFKINPSRCHLLWLFWKERTLTHKEVTKMKRREKIQLEVKK